MQSYYKKWGVRFLFIDASRTPLRVCQFESFFGELSELHVSR